MNTPAPLLNAWVRAVFVVAAIPLAWAGELWLGMKLVEAPELIFGEVASTSASWLTAVLPVLIGAAVLWIVAKTPFLALSWALDYPFHRHHDRREDTKEEVQSSE